MLSSTIVGAALLLLASTATAQNVAQMSKNGNNLVINANDVRFDTRGTHGAEGKQDTILGWQGDMVDIRDEFDEALNSFKTGAKQSIDSSLVKNKATVSAFNNEAEAMLSTTDKELDAAVTALTDSLDRSEATFEDKVSALKLAIEDKLAAYEALADTVPTKIETITKVLKESKDKAAEDTNAFKSSLGPQVAVVMKELAEKKSDTKPIWVGGTAKTYGRGWGWYGLDRVDLDAKGDHFTASGTQFTIKKDGLYRLNYQGRTRGRNCAGYALVQLNGRWINAEYYNKHISGSNTYNPQNVDVTWKYEQGDKVKLYLYDCVNRYFGSPQGRLDSYNRISFSFEGENEATILAK